MKKTRFLICLLSILLLIGTFSVPLDSYPSQSTTDFYVKWTYPIEDFFVTTPTLIDLDGNGIKEVLTSGGSNKLFCLEANGSLRWEKTLV